MSAPLLFAVLAALAQATPDPGAVAEPDPTATPAVTPAVGTAATAEPQDPLWRAPTVRPFEMPDVMPAEPIPYTAGPAPITPTKAVAVEAYHRDYEGPQDSLEVFYEQGVRDASAAEQALRGGLDGWWTVSAADGAAIFSFVLDDPGAGGEGGVEGAWRDLRKGGGVGLIDTVAREGRVLTVRFRAGGEPASLRLTPAPDGRWRGELKAGGGTQAVVMTHS